MSDNEDCALGAALRRVMAFPPSSDVHIEINRSDLVSVWRSDRVVEHVEQAGTLTEALTALADYLEERNAG